MELALYRRKKHYDNSEFLPGLIAYHNNVLSCVVPDFKEYINPIQLRRLSRMLRIGLNRGYYLHPRFRHYKTRWYHYRLQDMVF